MIRTEFRMSGRNSGEPLLHADRRNRGIRPARSVKRQPTLSAGAWRSEATISGRLCEWRNYTAH